MLKFLDEYYGQDGAENLKIKEELKKAYGIYVKFLIFNFIRTGLKMDKNTEDKNEQ